MRFLYSLTLIFIAFSYSYALNINHFVRQLDGNDEVSNIQSVVNKGNKRTPANGVDDFNEKPSCSSPFSKTSHCCLDPLDKPEHFQKILSIKMQCVEELGLNATKMLATFCDHNKEEKNKDDKDKEEKHKEEKPKEEKIKEEKNKEEKHKDDKHKEDYNCVMHCVGLKQGIIDDNGKIDEIKMKNYIKENVIGSEWQHAISDDIVQKCINKFQNDDSQQTPVTVVSVVPAPLPLAILPGVADTIKVNIEAQIPDTDVKKNSKSLDMKKQCTFNGYKIAKCIYREFITACPVDKQKDTKMCIRVREKFLLKNEKNDFNKKLHAIDTTTVKLTEVKADTEETVPVVIKDEKLIVKIDKDEKINMKDIKEKIIMKDIKEKIEENN